MFGVKGSVDSGARQKNVFDHLKDAQLTPEQKATFCYDQGICPTCGVKTHWIGPFKRRPYTNDKVDKGVCRACNPKIIFPPMEENSPAAKEGRLPNWKWRHVPGDGLLSKTSGAFSNISEGINNTVTNISKSTQAATQQARIAGFPQFPFSVNHKQNSQTDNEEPKTMSSCLKMEFSKKESSDEQQRKQDGKLLKSTSSIAAKEEIVGKNVTTAYGPGKVVGYRAEDDIFRINLVSLDSTGPRDGHAMELFCRTEAFSIDFENIKRQKHSMELNEAYEAMEKMRRLNLEVECGERGITDIDFEQCTTCLLNSADGQSLERQPENFRRIRKFMKDNQRKKKPEPCIFCANPSCQDHCSPEFRKEGITACNDCCKIFQPEYITDCMNNAHELNDGNDDRVREREVDHMVDLYDRVLLLLQYSSQYIEPLAEALEDSKKKSNTANVTGSSVGIVSGALGVAAAATLFTPAGAPLLLASLVLGGSATAVQTGAELNVQYFSEPHKVAGRLISLWGMLHNLLRVKETLREVLTARLIDLQDSEDYKLYKGRLEDIQNKKQEAALKLSSAAGRMGSTALLGGFAGAAATGAAAESAALMTGVEVGGMNYFTKVGTGLSRGARFARGFGGALSAATILLEAKTMSSTIEQIRAGNPCDKANTLRKICEQLPTLPSTKEIDDECRIYLGAMSNKANAPSLEDAIKTIEAKAIEEWQMAKAKEHEAEAEVTTSSDEKAPAGVTILDGEDGEDLELWASTLKQNRRIAHSLTDLPNEDSPLSSEDDGQSRMARSMVQMPSQSSAVNQSSLFERIQKFKEHDQLIPIDDGTSKHTEESF